MADSEPPNPDVLRQRALRRAYTEIAAALLRDEQPDDFPFCLLTAALMDAALSGDRALVGAAQHAIARLQRYEPADAPWRAYTKGQLEALADAADICLMLLERELTEQTQ